MTTTTDKIEAFYKTLPMFIPVSFKYNGKRMGADIQTRGASADCKIGNFGENWWIRPRSATRPDFVGYESISKLNDVVKRCLHAKGATDIQIDDVRVMKTYWKDNRGNSYQIDGVEQVGKALSFRIDTGERFMGRPIGAKITIVPGERNFEVTFC